MSIINNAQATIDTAVPAISIGQIMLSADRRSTKEKPLSDAERIRRAVLPAGHWGELNATVNGNAPSGLTDLLRAKLVEVANDRLRDALAAEPMLRLITLSDYSVSALLAWSAETATSRGALTFTREQVEAWFDASATMRALTARAAAKGTNPAQVLTFAKNRFATLAAKNHGLKEVSDVDKLLSIIDPADLEGEHATLLVELTGRLEHIRKTMLARADAATISMDDL